MPDDAEEDVSQQVTDYTGYLKTTAAGIVLLSYFGLWLAMEWTGRQPDSLVVVGAVAIALGSGFYLWRNAMGQGVSAVGELQDGGGE